MTRRRNRRPSIPHMHVPITRRRRRWRSVVSCFVPYHVLTGLSFVQATVVDVAAATAAVSVIITDIARSIQLTNPQAKVATVEAATAVAKVRTHSSVVYQATLSSGTLPRMISSLTDVS